MIKASLISLSIVLSLGLLASGCGGGGGTASTAGTAKANHAESGEAQEPAKVQEGSGGGGASIGKAAFVKRANAICATAKKKIIAEVTAASKNSPSAKRLSEIVSTTVEPELLARYQGIRALGLPTGEEAETSALLEIMREQVEEVKEGPLTFGESAEAKQRADKPAKELGLTECTLAWL